MITIRYTDEKWGGILGFAAFLPFCKITPQLSEPLVAYYKPHELRGSLLRAALLAPSSGETSWFRIAGITNAGLVLPPNDEALFINTRIVIIFKR